MPLSVTLPTPQGIIAGPFPWYQLVARHLSFLPLPSMTQWDFKNKGIRTSPARLSFVLKVPLRHLRPSVIYSVPCDRILHRAHYSLARHFYICRHCFTKVTLQHYQG